MERHEELNLPLRVIQLVGIDMKKEADEGVCLK
jgi:hypothetical protein